jgi:hypothetical protein
MRVYQREYHATTDNKMLIEKLDKVLETTDKELFNKNYKLLCRFFRHELGIQDVVGLLLKKDLSQIVIVPFSVKATEDNFYMMKHDGEKKEFYIEVEEGVELID